jgi:tetratricopeptide (TPR) repeat protein
MVAIGAICSFLFLGLGIYGGISAYSRWIRTETGLWVFEPLPALYFGVGLLVGFLGMVAGMRETSGNLLLVEYAFMPFGMLGAVLWIFALGLETGSRMMAESLPPLTRTFDRGDGFMAKGAFADAEREFRIAVEADPHNAEALLRLSRALEGAGKLQAAAAELAQAHSRIIDHRNDPAPVSAHWQQRLLSITFALGDLYSAKLLDQMRAQQLYKTTLEYLYGYRDANALRDRLKRLERGLAPVNADSTAAPERLPLE